ncbi:hypothetical protein ACIRG5_19095 [Lentzea sp. NPDC102401]|uniref:hypothetical protein n=1 Tax=Lentzea sp. NPDC102401 TaxID=3364128 RepID=UPI0037FF39BB
MRDAVRVGQQSPAELVDRYGLRCDLVREGLVRYLTELCTRQDFGLALSAFSDGGCS